MNSRWLIALRSTGLASVLLITMSVVGTAQRPASRGAYVSTHSKSFPGVARRLDMTTEAMDRAYDQAILANPRLTPGQFVAANMLARNLGHRHAGITTSAILAGLASGKNMGQTLKSLGLSAKEAKRAEKDAKRVEKDAQRVARAESKR